MTNTELAILSLLIETPRHGYELEQVIDHRGMREWTEIGFSSIYYILKKLENQGLVFSQSSMNNVSGPTRKIFTVTEKGKKVWRTAALGALDTPGRAYRSLDIGLANIPALPRIKVIKALTKYRQSLEDRQASVIKTSQYEFNQVSHVQIMFDLALTQIQAELEWLNRTIKKLLSEEERNENTTN